MAIEKPIRFSDGLVFLGIGRGLETIVEVSNFERPIRCFFAGGEETEIRICDHRWSAVGGVRGFYAGINISRGLSRERNVKMHRLIIGAKPAEIVDHINHVKTDNRRENLRIVTSAQNSQWHKPRSGRANSKFNGVHWDKHIQRWRAQTSFNGKRLHVGVFLTEEEAARAYDAKARELFGEFAKPNF